jgi:hypothetical protein
MAKETNMPVKVIDVDLQLFSAGWLLLAVRPVDALVPKGRIGSAPADPSCEGSIQ